MLLKELFETPAGTPTIYVDMDGVLADLFNHVGAIHDVEHYNKMTPDQWEHFFANTNAHKLFRDLPAFPTANALLKLTQPYGGYTILSSPLNFDREGSIKGKREWLAKNISVPSNGAVFEHEKYKYAMNGKTPNILIDDYGVNISKWRAAGGIAIKYQADENSLQMVAQALKQAMVKIKGGKDLISTDRSLPVAQDKEHENI